MSAVRETLELPHWDVSTIFPSLESQQLQQAMDEAVRTMEELDGLLDQQEPSFEEMTNRLNDLREKVRTISAYISSFVTTDSRNDLAAAKSSEWQLKMVALSRLSTRYEAWIGTIDLDVLLSDSSTARDHEFALRKMQISAKHQMTAESEDLAAALGPTGGGAWGRLRSTISSQLQVSVDGKGVMPMSAARALAHDKDPVVRKAAYEGEIKAWESVEVPIAAALNSIKGERNVLNEKRNWNDSLEPALQANNVDQQTLEAMQTACVESFPDFHRYLKAKAKLLAKPSLAWWDLFAPAGGHERVWTWDETKKFILDRFGAYSSKLASLAQTAFDDGWIDAEPRDGKGDGAFCMGIRRGESRVFLNFASTFSGVSTLAHELGHAYHGLNLKDRPPLQSQTPMALAETASIFCQTLITNDMLTELSGIEKLSILDLELEGSCQVVVDIHSRFLFESEVFTQRRNRELSVAELKEAMTNAQKATYGPGLDDVALHPYMWAVKGHYYGTSYYNWPYTFGLLFGLGLYSQYVRDPNAFRAGYDDLLSSTGLADAATLGQRFGVDFSSVDFWRASLDVIRERIAEFEDLASA